MDKIIDIKLGIVTMFTLFNSILGTLAYPIYILVSLNIIDYITGIMAATYRKQAINSYSGIIGIYKKISMWSLIFIGYVIDWLIFYTSNSVGQITSTVSAMVAIWLICNEIISLIENINDIGVPIPKLLSNFIKNTNITKKGRD